MRSHSHRILFAFFSLALFIFLVSCKKRPEIAQVLFKEFKNKEFKAMTMEGFEPVFRKVIEERADDIKNSELIVNYYKTHGYEPHYTLAFLPDDQLKYLVETYAKAPTMHGLNPEAFNYADMKALLNKFYDRKAIKSTDEAYRTLALLELQTANSLIKYASAMKYGVISPRKIFARYYMKTARPDSAFMKNVFTITDLKSFVDSIQPSSESYKKLQSALAAGASPETKRVIALNLERLRWQNKPSSGRYVWVNIPDYTLTYFNDNQPALNMKVCVGKGPLQSLQDADYDETEGSVRPHNHQTPIMDGMISYVQVNPVWNIPESIAKNEIVKYAAADPHYLANEGINVYTKSGELVDADAIDWSTVNAADYSFKQAPGEENALGKIKFMFPNSSAVYLHDTPSQAAFSKTVRAVSHGCVRVEQPLELAKALFGQGQKFETIKQEMGSANPTAKDITLPEKVPVYLDYMTAFIDHTGALQVRSDVYQYDRLLYNRMKSMIAL